MPKYKTLKEIHRFLIEKDLLHSIDNFNINKKKLVEEFLKENNNEKLPSFESGAKYRTEWPDLVDSDEF